MAFKAELFCPHPASRSYGGHFGYADQAHTLNQIKADGFFSTKGTRDRDQNQDVGMVAMFIQHQRDPNGTPADNPVRGHIIGSDGIETAAFVVNDTTGVVTLKKSGTPANWIIT